MPRRTKKHKMPEELKSDIRKKFLERITKLSKEINFGKVDKNAKEFYDILRKFFAKFFKIHYEFTYEELSKETERKRIDPRYKRRIEKLAEKLTYLEYSNIEMTNERLRELINEFKYLVKRLTLIKKEEKKLVTRRLDRVLRELSEKTNIFKKLKLRRVAKPDTLIKEINKLLEKSKEAIKAKEINRAREIYNEIDSLYRKLAVKDKNRVYKKITKVFKKRQPIYDLLNQAYGALINNRKEEARQLYMEISKLYNVLSIEDKEKVHSEILKVFKPKKKVDVVKLMEKTYYFIGNRDIENTGKMYSELEIAYKELSENEKEFFYPRLIDLYNDMKIIFS